MSWLYSQALVAAYSAGTCSDGEQSAPLSGNLTQQAYLSPDRMTAFSRLSRFGMTYKPLTDALGEELLTSYLAAFPVRTSVQQDEAPESTESGAECGGTWRESLGRYDRDTHTLKTAQCSLFEDLMSSSPTLPRWGSMQNGVLFRQQTLVRPISGSGSGLWGTPRVGMARGKNFWYDRGKHNLEEQVGAAEYAKMWPRPARSYLIPTPTASPDAPNHGSNSHGHHNLLEVAQTGWKPGMMWPTPRAGNPGSRPNGKGGKILAEEVAIMEGLRERGTKMWPTPTASDNRPRGTPHTTARRMRLGKQIGLEAIVKWSAPTVEDAGRAGSADAWRQYEQTGKTTGARLRNQVANAVAFATPQARDFRTGQESRWDNPTKTRNLNDQLGGQLNPTWVEWLMGWPLGWTDLKPLETDKWLQWLRQHGVY